MAYREKDTKKWTAQWFETNVMGEKKKRRKRGFETKREALEFERSKKLSNERSMDMKLSDFIEIYFSDKQNDLKDRTIKNKRYMMQQHIVPYFGNQMMSEIKASQIIQWQNEIQKKGYSDSYLRMIQNQLTSLFTHAAKIYDLPVNPCKKVKRMGNSDSRSLNFWTLDEYKQFIQTMEPGTRYYLMFEMLFWAYKDTSADSCREDTGTARARRKATGYGAQDKSAQTQGGCTKFIVFSLFSGSETLLSG